MRAPSCGTCAIVFITASCGYQLSVHCRAPVIERCVQGVTASPALYTAVHTVLLRGARKSLIYKEAS
jgi:hypothetical protein